LPGNLSTTNTSIAIEQTSTFAIFSALLLILQLVVMPLITSQTEYTVRMELYTPLQWEGHIMVDASGPHPSLEGAQEKASLKLGYHLDKYKGRGFTCVHQEPFGMDTKGWIRSNWYDQHNNPVDSLLCMIWIEEEDIYWYLYEDMDDFVWDRHMGDHEEIDLFAGHPWPIVHLPPGWERYGRQSADAEENALFAPAPGDPRPIVRLPPRTSEPRPALIRHDSLEPESPVTQDEDVIAAENKPAQSLYVAPHRRRRELEGDDLVAAENEPAKRLNTAETGLPDVVPRGTGRRRGRTWRRYLRYHGLEGDDAG
jgi:hypothetical protein